MLLSSYVYNNFELYNPTVSMEMIVWSLAGGLAIGALCSFFHRRSIGRLIRRLVAAGANTPETAITLEEAGHPKDPVLRYVLRSGAPLRSVILCANEDEFVRRAPSDSRGARGLRKLFSVEGEEKVVTDFRRARFYLPEELRIAAETRYDDKGTSVPSLLVSLVLIAAVAAAALYLLPELLTMLDNFLTMLGE